MRHHKTIRKFGRKKNQRNALMRSLAIALIRHGKIKTTEAKAKELRPYIEKMITMARKDSLHTRRTLISRLFNQETEVKILFEKIAPKYKDRNGGYTRITKLPSRLEDGAKMAVIELV